MENDRLNKIIEVARLYYQLDYSQQEIAKKLDVSRPTVSRLLKQAKDTGIVEIKINNPLETGAVLTERLKEKFGLKEVVVASVPDYEHASIKRHLGEVAADYLNKVVKDHDIIATSWGTTVYEVATQLKQTPISHTTVVQLNGGVNHSEAKTYASEIIHLFGEAFNTQTFLLPLPAIVDHIVVKQAIEADRHIRKILDLGKQANIAIFSVGTPVVDSALLQAEYFTKEDQHLIQSKAAGEICSRFFDKNGDICVENLNNRTIGIELHELVKKERSILVAGGPKKLEAIYGALKGKYANVLITDEHTASLLIELDY
ncbi:sugar-binding transcriptional regulator [Metabacillus sediminilitoris]|uniref:Sugar-binding transcriptional regulator n=1 Tax=Metabacillus sediminilitoris TaxID=2567941 RepID=A0A4S4C017_9BACI|nr:sugar-binding transcriptional regulator [Metabacillus sediminilitoris]QGQ47957.1 helix-turn-helix domain-containing protein [Metabacillus sediminilitoris]THF80929.1 sugar-binding transcriptional regulator [Metabacillus sediminilitoris]